MKTEFEIRVNGTRFTLWESVNVQTTLDKVCGQFQFQTSNKPKDYPVKPGDDVQILITGEPVMTGKVFEKRTSGSKDSNTVTIMGRDKTADILDSSLPDSAKNIEGQTTLKALCEKVISGLGADIKVIDKTGGIDPFTDKESEYGASVSNALNFLEGFAKKRQVYLPTDADGNLVLFKPDTSNKATSKLLHEENGDQNNVLTWQSFESHTQRYGKYVCRSQDNFGYDDDADIESGNDRKGESIDSEIRGSRYLELSAEESMPDAECKNRAKEENNLRRAKGLVYRCQVASAAQESGELWSAGQFITVRDDYADVSGVFIASAVTYSQNIAKGSITEISLSQPDAYLAKELNKQTTRKAKIGSN